MHSDLKAIELPDNGGQHIGNLPRSGETNRIRKRDLRHPAIDNQVAGLQHFVNIPHVSVGVPERH